MDYDQARLDSLNWGLEASSIESEDLGLILEGLAQELAQALGCDPRCALGHALRVALDGPVTPSGSEPNLGRLAHQYEDE